MTKLGEAVRKAYFDALGGFYQTKPMHEHQADAFEHIGRGLERAAAAAAAFPDEKDEAGLLAAALDAFSAETFTDYLARTLPENEYLAVIGRADRMATYRIEVREALARGERPPPFMPLTGG